MMRSALERNLLQHGFSLANGQEGIDFVSHDGHRVVEHQQAGHGVRSFYLGLMRLALYLAKHPRVEQGCLVVNRTRMSRNRLEEEWSKTTDVLRHDITQRLAVIAIEDDGVWFQPHDEFVTWLVRTAGLDTRTPQASESVIHVSPGPKTHEVLKVLLVHWLQRHAPVPTGELADEVGCSYPTVRKALAKTTARKAVHYTSNRSVAFQMFPHDFWSELVALSQTHRQSFRFIDRSGDRPDPDRLLARLRQLDVQSIAIGGVHAARFWHHAFDLHGTPRLDLIFHALDGTVDLSFVKKIDPALGLSEDSSKSPVLVVHPLVRARSLFVENPNGSTPYADPVETALDLDDLSLSVQSHQLLTHLRPEVRLG